MKIIVRVKGVFTRVNEQKPSFGYLPYLDRMKTKRFKDKFKVINI